MEKIKIVIVDDHILLRSALASLINSFDNRIVCLFQPHTYTRTRDQYLEFAKSFDEADEIIITDVYPARELPIEGVTGKLIADSAIQFGHKNVHYVSDNSMIEDVVKSKLKEGDILITMGAGNIWKIGENLIKQSGDL